MENLASKGPPMKNLVCNEKFGINCASAEAQFGTGRGINNKIIVKRNQIKRQQQGELLISGPTSAAARGNTLISWKLAGEQYKERFVYKIQLR